MPETKKQTFPDGFLWGSASSSYQTEGNNTNSNWWTWEHSEARLKQLFDQGKDPLTYQSGKATDFYNLYEQDLDLAAKLNHTAFRLSLEWSRIMPEPGRISYRELEHYANVLKAVRKRKMKVFLTLWHFSMPNWFAEKGGFEYQKNISDFVSYSELVAKKLGAYVDFWIPINEPEVYAEESYLRAQWPPQQTNWRNYLRVRKHLASAHSLAYSAIKKVLPDAQIGLAKNLIYFEAAHYNPINFLLKKIFQGWWNQHFIKKNLEQCDFIGVNYYFHKKINWRFVSTQGRTSDLNWTLSPKGLYEVLVEMRKFRKPVYITEHGLADEKDKYRSWYIRESLKSI